MKKIIYLAAVLFLASCGSKSKDKTAELMKLKKQQVELNVKIAKLEKEIGSKADSGGKVTDVSVISIVPSTFRNFIQIQGKVDAEENVIANAESPGVVTAIYVKAGQRVSKGQVLAQIDDKAIQQGIGNAKTQAELSRTLFERQKNLWDQKIGTEVQYLQAQAGKKSAELQLAQIEAQAGMYKIKSPITGTIDQMDLKLGQAIQPGSSSIRIINDSNLKAKATLAESYAGRVQKGDEVLVIFPDAIDADTLKTKITFAAKAIDPISRSFDVEVKLPSKKSYRPNMLAILKIVDYERKNAVVVPLNAIQRSETGEFVYIAENNVAKKVSIKVGGTYNGNTEVISGLKAGEQLIVTGVQDLSDGDRIKI
ncbi:MAG: efflux RND transporter periplasmic adaptor subunit [Sphingobacteriaceae bacterium]